MKLILHLPERLVWPLADFGGGIVIPRVRRGRRDHARRNLRRVVEWMAANGARRRAITAPRPRTRAALEALVNDRRSATTPTTTWSWPGRRSFTAACVLERLFVETPDEVEEWLDRAAGR